MVIPLSSPALLETRKTLNKLIRTQISADTRR